jgi:kinetochore protein Spc25
MRAKRLAEDVLLMRFTLVDPADPDREFAFVLDFSKDEYEGESTCSRGKDPY